MSKKSRPGYEALPLPPSQTIADLRERVLTTHENYSDGLITEGEAIALIVNDVATACVQYNNNLSACIRWCLKEKQAVGMVPDREGFTRLWDEVYRSEEE